MEYLQVLNVSFKDGWDDEVIIYGDFAYTNLTDDGFINEVIIGGKKGTDAVRFMNGENVEDYCNNSDRTKRLRNRVQKKLANKKGNKKRFWRLKGWRMGLSQDCKFEEVFVDENEVSFYDQNLRVDKDGNRLCTWDEKINLEMYSACD